MNETSIEIAGLRTVVVEPKDPCELVAVMLHGFAMAPEALSPFAHSLGIPARFFVPAAPLPAPEGRSWWNIDVEVRARSLATGPRDLSTQHPPDAPAARARLLAFLEEVRAWDTKLPIALIGFSQGGMLACDTYLRSRPDVSSLGLLSSSRIMLDEWLPLVHRIDRMPVLISHGRNDADLAFSAGEALRDLLAGAGADVTWVPFGQGHEIPLVVWRALRKFLSQTRRAT